MLCTSHSDIGTSSAQSSFVKTGTKMQALVSWGASNSDPTSSILNEYETRYSSGMERDRSTLRNFRTSVLPQPGLIGSRPWISTQNKRSTLPIMVDCIVMRRCKKSRRLEYLEVLIISNNDNNNKKIKYAKIFTGIFRSESSNKR